MAYSDIQDKLGQIKMTNMNQIYSKIPPVKGDLAVRQGDGGSPYTAPPKEETGPFVPAPKRDVAMDFNDAMGGGGWIGTQRTNVYINQGGEAYILEPNGNFKFDGMYSPEIHGPVFPRAQANNDMKIAAAPYSLNPQRIMLPNGRMEYAPINLRSDEQKENQHMMIYGGKWNKPIR